MAGGQLDVTSGWELIPTKGLVHPIEKKSQGGFMTYWVQLVEKAAGSDATHRLGGVAERVITNDDYLEILGGKVHLLKGVERYFRPSPFLVVRHNHREKGGSIHPFPPLGHSESAL